MISERSKSPLFGEHRIPIGRDETLDARLMLPRAPRAAKRLVFMAPLVGAGAAQAPILFRDLTRRGAVLMSFAYRGHPCSDGTFDLDATLLDTSRALQWAWQYARQHGLPLHGFAMCFGVIPLIAQFAPGGRGGCLWSLSGISGLFRLDQILSLGGFVRVLSHRLGEKLSVESFLAAVAQRALDCDGEPFRQALYEYLAGLFPELRVGRDHFEELRYDRADIPRTLLQFSQAQYLEGIRVPASIPCHFFFGRHDELMKLRTPEGRQAYRDQIVSLIPHAQVHELDMDHFGRGPDHDPVIQRLGDLFEECEARRAQAVCGERRGPLQDAPQ